MSKCPKSEISVYPQSAFRDHRVRTWTLQWLAHLHLVVASLPLLRVQHLCMGRETPRCRNLETRQTPNKFAVAKLNLLTWDGERASKTIQATSMLQNVDIGRPAQPPNHQVPRGYSTQPPRVVRKG